MVKLIASFGWKESVRLLALGLDDTMFVMAARDVVKDWYLQEGQYDENWEEDI